MKKIFCSVMTLALALAMVSCGGNSTTGVREPQELSGAGATFPLPFYNVVFEQFGQVPPRHRRARAPRRCRADRTERVRHAREFAPPQTHAPRSRR